MSSETERRLTLVCYDIANPRRRRSAARVILAYGERVQLSGYECWLNKAERRELVRRLVPYIDHREDSLRLYELRPDDGARVIRLGAVAYALAATNAVLCA